MTPGDRRITDSLESRRLHAPCMCRSHQSKRESYKVLKKEEMFLNIKKGMGLLIMQLIISIDESTILE